MKRFVLIIALTFGLLLYIVLGQARIGAATPSAWETKVNLLETRVSVLETAVAGLNNVALAGTDKLGLAYEFLQVDTGIEVASWDVHTDHDGYWTVAGSLRNKSTSARFSVADLKIHFYKGQRLIQISAHRVGSHWVNPGQALAFEYSANVKPDEIERYTIEVKGGDWRKVP